MPIFHHSSFPSFHHSVPLHPTRPCFVRPPNLPPYLPVASRVKPLQISNFERQVLILLATPTVYRMNNTKRKTKNGKAGMTYTDIAQTMTSKRRKPRYLTQKSFTPKVNFTELG